MPNPKPFKTYSEQLEILRSRGLHIDDEGSAIDALRRLNYYRLSAYSLTMRHKEPDGRERFDDGVTFEDILDLYYFDEMFRQTIFAACSIIESNMRAYLAYHLAKNYGPVGYMDCRIFEDPWRAVQTLSKVERQIDWRKSEPFVEHHKNDLGGVYPIWVLVEMCSFGELSKLYRNLKPSDRAGIAKEYFGISSREYIENWIHCAAVARNIAAHGGRFYNRPRFNPQAKLPDELKCHGEKVFPYVYVIFSLLPPDQRSTFVSAIQNAFISHPYAEPRYLGFPDNWSELLLESQATK